MPTRLSYHSPFAGADDYVLTWRRNFSFGATDFFLRRNSDQQSWGCTVSDEALVHTPGMDSRQVALEHVAYELSHASGIDNALIYNALHRLCNGYADGSVGRFVYPQREPVYHGRPDWAVGGPYEWERYTSPFLRAEPKAPQGDERAKELLLSYLNDEQKALFEKDKSFCCVGKKTGLTYQIHYGRVINVTRTESDSTKRKYCLVQESSVPLYDQLLTQKLLIENDEQRFLDKANLIK